MGRKWDGKVMLLVWGRLLGLVAAVLVLIGNPGNTAFCIACFIQDIAGAAELHTAAVVQYVRPEIAGLVAGSFAVSMAAKEYRSASGSSPMIRFLLGMVTMIGAPIFLGCPLRTALRMAVGDLDVCVGLAGFALGATTGCFFLKKEFSLGRTYDIRPESRYILSVILVVMLILSATTTLFAVSVEGPGSMHAPVLTSLAGGFVFGAAAQRARTCFAGGTRDVIPMKNFDPFIVIAGLSVVMATYNLATGGFELGFEGWPVAHTEAVWNVLGMHVVGFVVVLAGGCPPRQLILAGQGPGDAAVNMVGMLVGATICHNFGLASSGTGTIAAGKVTCVACTVLLFVIGPSCKGKQGKQEEEDRTSETNVRGLSCPEPMLIVMDEMDKHPGVKLTVLSDAAHTRDNIVRLVKEYGGEAVVAIRGRDIEITIF